MAMNPTPFVHLSIGLGAWYAAFCSRFTAAPGSTLDLSRYYSSLVSGAPLYAELGDVDLGMGKSVGGYKKVLQQQRDILLR